jgi:hypothetical protein
MSDVGFLFGVSSFIVIGMQNIVSQFVSSVVKDEFLLVASTVPKIIFCSHRCK